jgi:hypothetical protein
MLAAEICLLPAGDCAHSQSENEDEGEVKETTGVHAEGNGNTVTTVFLQLFRNVVQCSALVTISNFNLKSPVPAFLEF